VVFVLSSKVCSVVSNAFESRRRIGITHYLFCQQNSLRQGNAPLKPLITATIVIVVCKLMKQLIQKANA
jgi:hypothetical protein